MTLENIGGYLDPMFPRQTRGDRFFDAWFPLAPVLIAEFPPVCSPVPPVCSPAPVLIADSIT